VLVISSMILGACAPATTPTPETIIETVVVTEIVEGEVVEVGRHRDCRRRSGRGCQN
jgi:hypothetical protein